MKYNMTILLICLSLFLKGQSTNWEFKSNIDEYNRKENLQFLKKIKKYNSIIALKSSSYWYGTDIYFLLYKKRKGWKQMIIYGDKESPFRRLKRTNDIEQLPTSNKTKIDSVLIQLSANNLWGLNVGSLSRNTKPVPNKPKLTQVFGGLDGLEETFIIKQRNQILILSCY